MRNKHQTLSIFSTDEPLELFQYNTQNEEKLNFLKPDEIIYKLNSHINDISETFCLEYDYALLVFQKYRFNKQLLEQEFTLERDDVLKNLEISGDNKKQLKGSDYGQCKNCWDDSDNLISLNCGHHFCENCWKLYMLNKFNDKCVFFACMFQGCSKPVLNSFIKKILHDDNEALNKYDITLSKRYIEINQQYQLININWCPGTDCTYSLETNVIQQIEVMCPLGHIWCVICRQEAHRPISCAIVRSWNLLLSVENESFEWIKQNTKLCPHCHKPIQKNNGCNQIYCRPPGGCGESFCYVCNRIWQPSHSDHFKCPFESQIEQADDLEVKKHLLQTYNPHYKNFHECNQNFQYIQINMIPFIDDIELLCVDKINDIQPQSLGFIKESLYSMQDALIRLKWTYCLTHFIEESGNHIEELNILRNHQECLSSRVQDLRKIFEKEFLDNLKSDQLQKKQNKSIWSCNQFEKIKDRFLENIKLISTYKKLLLQEIENVNFIGKQN